MQPVVLMNVFEVPSGSEQTFLLWWKEHSELFRDEPGFINAWLYRSVSDDAHFSFINIAHWETADCLAAARAKHITGHPAPPDIKGHPALYALEVQY
ncbi:antibiotic biosynthesis monooxygenase [Ktedonosporobacter rubrisoli]|uniref:Antibiotic biosynthesis monooxygenase n=1 Tax=Ktedonosporobacter rubrisoli TaxID=2509675 RepID=A0A4P6JNN0_KTERU|nr:antibiotic biosynthesis monooxygenase family protein [Ktedonosporobacter rubrisoli]QBD76894.1 antibiotic biosynthesis monooxygenase [Ktedonosporobacter rubrisoli]